LCLDYAQKMADVAATSPSPPNSSRSKKVTKSHSVNYDSSVQSSSKKENLPPSRSGSASSSGSTSIASTSTGGTPRSAMMPSTSSDSVTKRTGSTPITSPATSHDKPQLPTTVNPPPSGGKKKFAFHLPIAASTGGSGSAIPSLQLDSNRAMLGSTSQVQLVDARNAKARAEAASLANKHFLGISNFENLSDQQLFHKYLEKESEFASMELDLTHPFRFVAGMKLVRINYLVYTLMNVKLEPSPFSHRLISTKNLT